MQSKRNSAESAGEKFCRTASISVVIPAYNEAESVGKLVNEILAQSASNPNIEVIVVDDCSTDGTSKVVEEISDYRVRVIRLRRNRGQSFALMSGLRSATQEWICILDADGQNPAHDLIELGSLVDPDIDAVLGFRKNRHDSALRVKVSNLGNWYLRMLTGTDVLDFGCSAKLVRRTVLQSIDWSGDMHRYMGALVKAETSRVGQAMVSHEERRFGQSKYGYGRAVRVLLDAIALFFRIRFGDRPMRFFGAFFLVSSIIALLILGTALWLKFSSNLPLTDNPLLVSSLVLFGVSLNALFAGLISEVLIALGRREALGREEGVE